MDIFAIDLEVRAPKHSRPDLVVKHWNMTREFEQVGRAIGQDQNRTKVQGSTVRWRDRDSCIETGDLPCNKLLTSSKLQFMINVLGWEM